MIKEADTQSGEDCLRSHLFRFTGDRPALMLSGARLVGSAGFQNFGTSGPFGIFQLTVLGDDQSAAQRNHHQDPEQAAKHRDQHYARDFKIQSQNHNRRHGYADTERD